MNKEKSHLFPYAWTLKGGYPAKGIGQHGLKVFSCFACGGGSTMGYKLAGYDVIGFNEIDPKMAACYIENHNPKHKFIEPIQDFKSREDLPEELYNLDILDGSPPCSSFSMAGSREKGWGKKKKFREGQAEQVLDTLFFDFIELAKRLKPKVVIAENVKGLLLGDAKEYMYKIWDAFNEAGYSMHYKLLDASTMGVPQRRERVFFYAIRKDLEFETCDLLGNEPYLKLEYNENPLLLDDIDIELGDPIEKCYGEDYDRLKRGEKNKYLQSQLIKKNKVHPTITASYKQKASPMPEWEKRWLSDRDICKIGTFPIDYDFKKNKPSYIVGMSVPPVMIAQVAHQVYIQILSKYT